MTKQLPNASITPELKGQLDQAGREADVKVELLKLGVGRSRILELVEGYSLDRIEQQLAWLPYRRARKPSSLIVSAVIENYAEPAGLLEAAARKAAAALETTAASSNSSEYKTSENESDE